MSTHQTPAAIATLPRPKTRPLTAAQQAALNMIRTKGVLHCGNRVSISTVRALEARGLVTVEAKMVKEKSWRTGVDTGRWVCDWVARPAGDHTESHA